MIIQYSQCWINQWYIIRINVPGMYYTESKNDFSLHNNGQCYKPMVEYCLENNIITLENIKYVVRAHLTVQSDYYTPFINTLGVETEAPIYEQIAQIVAIELLKLSRIIGSKGSQVLYLCTDKLYAIFQVMYSFLN